GSLREVDLGVVLLVNRGRGTPLVLVKVGDVEFNRAAKTCFGEREPKDTDGGKPIPHRPVLLTRTAWSLNEEAIPLNTLPLLVKVTVGKSPQHGTNSL